MSQTSELMYHTFKEWKKLGYEVHVGEKSHKINEEFEPMFSEKQVSKFGNIKYDYDFFPYHNSWDDIGDIY